MTKEELLKRREQAVKDRDSIDANIRELDKQIEKELETQKAKEEIPTWFAAVDTSGSSFSYRLILNLTKMNQSTKQSLIASLANDSEYISFDLEGLYATDGSFPLLDSYREAQSIENIITFLKGQL